MTIDPSGTELINASSTLLLQPGDSAVVVSDGIQWYTIGLGQQAVFAFDYTTIAVTGGTYTLSGSELNRIAYKFTGTLTSNVNIVEEMVNMIIAQRAYELNSKAIQSSDEMLRSVNELKR